MATGDVAGTPQRVREQALDAADRQRQSIAGKGKEIVREAEKFAGQLEDAGAPAGVVKTAVSQVDDLASYIEQTPVEQIIRDATRTAQRHPFTFVSTAFALGVASSRLLKTGAPEPDLAGVGAGGNGLDTGAGTSVSGLRESGAPPLTSGWQ
jgi:hypothetical protein